MTMLEVEEASVEDEEIQKVRQALDTGGFDECKAYAPVAGELCKIGQLVLRGTRLVIPQRMRAAVLALAHERHLGVVGTKWNLRTKVRWPGIEKAAETLSFLSRVPTSHKARSTRAAEADTPARWAMARLGRRPNGTSPIRSLPAGSSRLLQPLLRSGSDAINNDQMCTRMHEGDI